MSYHVLSTRVVLQVAGSLRHGGCFPILFLRELSLDPALQRRESLGLFPSRPSHMSLDIYPYYMGSTPMLHAYFGCQIRAEGPMLLHGGSTICQKGRGACSARMR